MIRKSCFESLRQTYPCCFLCCFIILFLVLFYLMFPYFLGFEYIQFRSFRETLILMRIRKHRINEVKFVFITLIILYNFLYGSETRQSPIQKKSKQPDYSILPSDIVIMFVPFTIKTFLFGFHSYFF